MVCPTLLLAIAAQYSRSSFGPLCATFWVSNGGSLLPFILRLMAKLSDKTSQWKLTLEPLLIMSKTTRQSSYPWQNSLIITQNTPIRGTRFSSSTVGTTYVFPIKKPSNSTLGPKQLMIWLRNLRTLWLHIEKNLKYAQKLQKWAYDKRTKPRSYISGEKVWLNSKYIKTKCNQKLETKFFRLFRVLHLVSSQAYKLELLKQ